jgi:hypothetical protein
MLISKFIRKAATAVGFVALFSIGASAQAEVVLSIGSFGPGYGVHSDGGDQDTRSGGSLLAHVNQEDSAVTFSTNNWATNPIAFQGGGEATVIGGMTQLNVDFEHAWTRITFDLEPLNGNVPENLKSFTFNLTVTMSGGSSVTFDQTNCTICNSDKDKSGQFVLTSDVGIQHLAFTFDPIAGDAKQFRVNGLEIIPPTPEPSTWAMIFLGFAGIAYLASRRRKAVGQQPATGLSFA